MSENPQHFENPLHWVQLFSRGIYYIPDDTIPVLDQVKLPAELVAELPAELPSEPPGEIMDTIKENSLLEANIDRAQVKVDKPFPMASEVILANVFMDEVDRVFLEDVALTFQRLMAALKVGNQTINPDKIANFHQPNDIFSQDNGFSKGASFSAAFTIIWSDQILKELPEMYEIDTTSTGSSLRLPSFNTMIGSEGLKRKAWQCILNMLALEKSSDS